MTIKTATLLLSLVLLLGIGAGGTLAWFTDVTNDVTNTFTVGDINITLEETTGDTYQMIPGYTITKDPKVTVIGGSEKCWLFVKIVKDKDFDSYMTYSMAEGWEALTGESGVYYRIVETNSENQSYAVMLNDTIQVKSDVTKDQLNLLYKTTTNSEGETVIEKDANGKPIIDKTKCPTLTFTAYACQYYSTNDVSFEVSKAWENVNK